KARNSVTLLASRYVSRLFQSAGSTCVGPGRTYDGFQPDHTTHCHASSPRTMAPSLGQAARQMRESRDGPGSIDCSRASRPASSVPTARSRVATMAAHLLAQSVGDLGGEAGDLGRVDAAGTWDVD